MAHIGKRIEEFLKSKNLSGSEMGELLDVSPANVYMTFKKEDLSTKYIQILIKKFGCDPMIFFDKGEMKIQEIKNPDIRKAMTLLDEARQLIIKSGK